MTTSALTQQPAGPRRKRLQFGEKQLPIALLLPAILIMLFVIGIPMVYSFYLSLTDYSLSSKTHELIGFQNYVHLLTDDPLFWASFGRTILFMTLAVNIEFLLGLGIAQLMAKVIRGQGALRTIMMMPMMFAPILVGFQFKWFFNAQIGLVNNRTLQHHRPTSSDRVVGGQAAGVHFDPHRRDLDGHAVHGHHPGGRHPFAADRAV